MMTYSEGQLRFIRIWVKIALVIGVILPLYQDLLCACIKIYALRRELTWC